MTSENPPAHVTGLRPLANSSAGIGGGAILAEQFPAGHPGVEIQPAIAEVWREAKPRDAAGFVAGCFKRRQTIRVIAQLFPCFRRARIAGRVDQTFLPQNVWIDIKDPD